MGPYVLSGGPLIFTFSFFSQGLLVSEMKLHKMKLYFGSRIFWQCNVKSCKKKVRLGS